MSRFIQIQYDFSNRNLTKQQTTSTNPESINKSKKLKQQVLETKLFT